MTTGTIQTSHLRRAGIGLLVLACVLPATARAEGPAAMAAPAPAPSVSPPAATAPAAIAPPRAADATTAPAPGAPPAAASPDASTTPPDFYPTAGMGMGGAVGFGRFESAESGRPGSLRVGLDLNYFQRAYFPTNSFDRYIAGELGVGYTWMKNFDTYAAIHNSSNYNGDSVPALVQALGDIIVGTKYGFDLGGSTLAFDLRLDLKSGLGNDYVKPADSNLGLRALSTTPFTLGDQKLALTANFGFVFARSEDAVNPELTPALLYGTGYSAYNQIVGGVQLMYDLGKVKPFASFDLDIPTGVSGHALAPWHATEWSAGGKRGGIGARIEIAPNAGDIDLLVEWATSTGAIGFARTEPWMVTAGYSFAFDGSLYVPPPPPVKVVAPPPPPSTADLRGTILDVAVGAPVKGAVITIDGYSPVATDASGLFVVHGLQPGTVTGHIEREGYKPVTFQANVAVGSAQSVQAKIEPLPPPPPPAAPPPPELPPPPPPVGFIAGQIRSSVGGVQGVVKVFGPQRTEARTDTEGTFSIKLDPGRYEVTLLPDTYLARGAVVTVYADKASAVVVQTEQRPAAPSVKLDGDKITLVKPFSLDEKRAEPNAKDMQILSELADIIARDPTKRLLINVHSDKRKDKSDRKDWTESRAAALRLALINEGVPPDRVIATGMGLTQPLVPFTSRAAAKNRRVELILEPMPVTKIIQIKPATPAGAAAAPAASTPAVMPATPSGAMAPAATPATPPPAPRPAATPAAPPAAAPAPASAKPAANPDPADEFMVPQ